MERRLDSYLTRNPKRKETLAGNRGTKLPLSPPMPPECPAQRAYSKAKTFENSPDMDTFFVLEGKFCHLG